MVETRETANSGIDFSKLSSKPALAALLVAFVLAIVIFIWGQFHGVSQVPWPEDRVPASPEKAFQEASRYFDSDLSFKFVSRAALREDARALLKEDLDVDPVPALLETWSQKYGGGPVVIENSPQSLADTAFETAAEDLKTTLAASVSQMETEIDQMMPWDRDASLEKLRAKRGVLSRIEALVAFMKEGRILAPVRFLNEQAFEGFSFVATDKLERIQEGSSSRIFFSADSARPACSASFLEKAGVPESIINEEKLKADKEQLKSFVENARPAYEALIDQIKQQIAVQRGQARTRFYDQWFPVLIQGLVTFFMLWLLLIFFRIIRRKGLPRKTTFEVYFATNVTSMILRWIALVIIALGMLGLVVALIGAIAKAGISMYAAMEYPFIYRLIPSFILGSSYVFAILNPIVQALVIAATAWGFVLWSEFVCFLSSCYHVMFEKAYKTDSSGYAQKKS